MKTNTKPIGALLSGAILLLGGLCQTVQAQGIVAGSMTDNLILGSTTSANSPSTDLTVDSWVTLTGSTYTYNYILNDPTSDDVANFSVSFDATAPGAYISTTQTGGILNEDHNANGLEWVISLSAGSSSGTLSFQSDDAPTTYNANASDTGSAPSPWASDSSLEPGGEPFLGQQVYGPGPSEVPEPTTTALLAGCLLLLPFRSTILKKV